jgi:hypothetical protein
MKIALDYHFSLQYFENCFDVLPNFLGPSDKLILLYKNFLLRSMQNTHKFKPLNMTTIN